MSVIFDNVFRRDLSVTRKGIGSFQNLVWVESPSNSFIIKASVQPTPAEVMETLPEGYRTSESYTLYTDTELRTSDVNNKNPDVISIFGKRFLVVKVGRWRNDLINHYQIVVVKDESDVA